MSVYVLEAGILVCKW